MWEGIYLSKFFPFMAVTTAPIPSPELWLAYFLRSRDSVRPKCYQCKCPHSRKWAQRCTEYLRGIFASGLEDQNDNIIILLMENLPPIHDMYASMQQQRDYDVIRKYEHNRVENQLKRSPTKKGSFLDDAIRMNHSPGPANKSNVQFTWAKPCHKVVKYSDRKTYIDQIKPDTDKKKSPSPNHYNIKMAWPDKSNSDLQVSEKTNFLDHSEYESNQTPGPGTYLVATHIAKKFKEYHHTQNKPLQPRKQMAADMNTYDPIPVSYATFKMYEKVDKNKSAGIKKQEPKKERENLSPGSVPGPGHYQMINSWEGKEKKLPKGSLSYLGKISKGPTLNVYYH